MNTKEVIENLEALKYCDSLYGNKNEASKLDDAIELLKSGEKYEAMYKELREDYGEYRIDCELMDNVRLEEVMDNFKQKYFPKEK